jgi:hypothetical protein
MVAMPNYAERRLTHQMRLVELRFGASIAELMRRLRREGLNAVQVADRLDIPYGTLHRWLVRFELNDASLIRRALEASDERPPGTGSASNHESIQLAPGDGPPAGGGVRNDQLEAGR